MSYTKAVQKYANEGSEAGDTRLACRECKQPTLRETLVQYSMCFRCFEGYCSAAPGKPDHHNIAGGPGPLAWAHRMKVRDESGERLNKAQATMWRAALYRLQPSNT